MGRASQRRKQRAARAAERSGQTCYACDSAATTDEHLPPKVFYPETKDLGEDARKQLVTVPACKTHNNEHSMDDEYAAFAISCTSKKDTLGLQQFSTKVVRALYRSPALIQTVFAQARRVQTDEGETMAFTFDLKRVESVMKRIAAGMWYRKTGLKLLNHASLRVHSPDLRNSQTLEQPFAVVAAQLERVEGWVTVPAGDPRVFQCEFIEDTTKWNDFFLRMSFYEASFRVWVIADGVVGR